MSIDSRHIVEQRSRAERTANAEVIPVPDPAPDAAYAGTESEESDAAGLPLVPLQPSWYAAPASTGSNSQSSNRRCPSPSPRRLRTSRSLRSTCRSAPVRGRRRSGNGNGTAMHQEADEAGSPLLPLPPITPRFGFEELRVDVDGIKPTMTVSGTITRLFGGPAHLDRPGHEGPGDRCAGPDRSATATAALVAAAGHVSVQLTGGPFLPGEPEGDRHVQRRLRRPGDAALHVRDGGLPRGGLRVRHGERRDRRHLAQPGQPPEPRAVGCRHRR